MKVDQLWALHCRSSKPSSAPNNAIEHNVGFYNVKGIVKRKLARGRTCNSSYIWNRLMLIQATLRLQVLSTVADCSDLVAFPQLCLRLHFQIGYSTTAASAWQFYTSSSQLCQWYYGEFLRAFPSRVCDTFYWECSTVFYWSIVIASEWGIERLIFLLFFSAYPIMNDVSTFG